MYLSRKWSNSNISFNDLNPKGGFKACLEWRGYDSILRPVQPVPDDIIQHKTALIHIMSGRYVN